MRKIIALVLVLLMAIPFAACKKDDGKYTVGICQFIQHDALDAATKGFKQALIDKLGSENVEFVEENAAGDTANCTTIVNSLVSAEVDLIMANATPALQAAANATRSIPVLGTSVTEYGVALNIDNFSGTVGTNVSGTVVFLPTAPGNAAPPVPWRPCASDRCGSHRRSDRDLGCSPQILPDSRPAPADISSHRPAEKSHN